MLFLMDKKSIYRKRPVLIGWGPRWRKNLSWCLRKGQDYIDWEKADYTDWEKADRLGRQSQVLFSPPQQPSVSRVSNILWVTPA